MAIDTNQTLVVPADLRWRWLPLGFGLVCLAAAVWVAAHTAHGWLMWTLLLTGGIVSAANGFRLVTQRGPALVFSPEGFRDVQVSPDVLPWSSIASIAEVNDSGNRLIVLTLQPGADAGYRIRPLADLGRRLMADKIGPGRVVLTAAYGERYA
jgi:hypothetical protein